MEDIEDESGYYFFKSSNLGEIKIYKILKA
jgi:hypothetical protein